MIWLFSFSLTTTKIWLVFSTVNLVLCPKRKPEMELTKMTTNHTRAEMSESQGLKFIYIQINKDNQILQKIRYIITQYLITIISNLYKWQFFSNTASNSDCGNVSPVCQLQRRKHLRATVNLSDDKNHDNVECDSGENGTLDRLKINRRITLNICNFKNALNIFNNDD